MMTPANDNLGPLELRICHLEDFPDHVWIAMNRPDAIYGADHEEAERIVSDIMGKIFDKTFSPQEIVRNRETDAYPVLSWTTMRGRWMLALDEWTEAERQFIAG
jgi:hypothetical protein